MGATASFTSLAIIICPKTVVIKLDTPHGAEMVSGMIYEPDELV